MLIVAVFSIKFSVDLSISDNQQPAVCAGVGVGIYRDFSEAKRINAIVDTVMPREENRLRYDRLYEIFNHAYDALTGVYGELGAYRKEMGEKHE